MVAWWSCLASATASGRLGGSAIGSGVVALGGPVQVPGFGGLITVEVSLPLLRFGGELSEASLGLGGIDRGPPCILPEAHHTSWR